MRVTVQLHADHLERLAARRSPVQALAELIWNALDGDATTVDVAVIQNGLQTVEEIRIRDNGHGITHAKAVSTFGSLGASWKKGVRSPTGRRLHGQAGEGRYSGFCLGKRVRWISVSVGDGGGPTRVDIEGTSDDLGGFDISDPRPAGVATTGTEVVITDIQKQPRSLVADDVDDRLAEIFALYLRQYREVRISINGRLIDPTAAEILAVDYNLPAVRAQDGRAFPVQLTVIEWRHKVEREILLCDGGGFALESIRPGIHAPGCDFTAYLKSDFIREAFSGRMLVLAEMDPELRRLIDDAKDKLRAHFRKRLAEQARSVVEQWKAERIYPYEGPPQGTLEEVERQVFDVLALNVNEYLPDFATADARSKKWSLHMLKTAIESSPEAARRIIEQVLVLPHEKQAELVELLDRTSLTAIINTSKLVVDRLDFLAGLEVLLFDPVARQKVKERKHLHRILAQNTWLFGEEFHLTVDDQSLTSVLERHLHELGAERTELAPVTTDDGETGIVDLMLSRRIPQARPDDIEHLVIELKRPSVVVDDDVLKQLKKYAHAVVHDERFRDTRTRWTFWAISNNIHDRVRWELEDQRDRPAGMLLRTENPSMVLWVKTWGQVIESARARLQLFRTELNHMATQNDGLAFVQRMYAKYLPDVLRADEPEAADAPAVATGASDAN